MTRPISTIIIGVPLAVIAGIGFAAICMTLAGHGPEALKTIKDLIR